MTLVLHYTLVIAALLSLGASMGYAILNENPWRIVFWAASCAMFTAAAQLWR